MISCLVCRLIPSPLLPNKCKTLCSSNNNSSLRQTLWRVSNRISRLTLLRIWWECKDTKTKEWISSSSKPTPWVTPILLRWVHRKPTRTLTITICNSKATPLREWTWERAPRLSPGLKTDLIWVVTLVVNQITTTSRSSRTCLEKPCKRSQPLHRRKWTKNTHTTLSEMWQSQPQVNLKLPLICLLNQPNSSSPSLCSKRSSSTSLQFKLCLLKFPKMTSSLLKLKPSP